MKDVDGVENEKRRRQQRRPQRHRKPRHVPKTLHFPFGGDKHAHAGHHAPDRRYQQHWPRRRHRINERQRKVPNRRKRRFNLSAVRGPEPHQIQRHPTKQQRPVDPPRTLCSCATLRRVHPQDAELLRIDVPDVPRSGGEDDSGHDQPRFRIPKGRRREETDEHEYRKPCEPSRVRVEYLAVQIHVGQCVVTMGKRQPHHDEEHRDLLVPARKIGQRKKEDQPAKCVG